MDEPVVPEGTSPTEVDAPVARQEGSGEQRYPEEYDRNGADDQGTAGSHREAEAADGGATDGGATGGGGDGPVDPFSGRPAESGSSVLDDGSRPVPGPGQELSEGEG
jgi:hypothetical protein